MFIIIIGIFAIGIKVRNHLLTLFMSICLFLLPLLFAYGGYHFIDFISLYPLLFHGQFVSNIEGLLQILFSFYWLWNSCCCKFEIYLYSL